VSPAPSISFRRSRADRTTAFGRPWARDCGFARRIPPQSNEPRSTVAKIATGFDPAFPPPPVSESTADKRQQGAALQKRQPCRCGPPEMTARDSFPWGKHQGPSRSEQTPPTATLIAQTIIGTDSTLCTGDIDASPPAGPRRCLSQVSACRTNEGKQTQKGHLSDTR
jgi:hypothetical protein